MQRAQGRVFILGIAKDSSHILEIGVPSYYMEVFFN